MLGDKITVIELLEKLQKLVIENPDVKDLPIVTSNLCCVCVEDFDYLEGNFKLGSFSFDKAKFIPDDKETLEINSLLIS